MDGLNWDLESRGPLQQSLSRFFDVESGRNSTRAEDKEQFKAIRSSELNMSNEFTASLNNSLSGDVKIAEGALAQSLILSDRLRRDEQQELRLTDGLPEHLACGYDIIR